MPYRNELDALKAQEAQLSAEAEELESHLSQHRDRKRRLAEVRRARKRIQTHMDASEAAARTQRVLPLLDHVRVASPCKEPWDDMVGDAHHRHCARCTKDVYDLSSLTRAQAEALLLQHEGQRLCVRFYRRKDGRVMTSDCAPAARRKRAVGVAAAASLAALTAVVGAELHDPIAEFDAPCAASGDAREPGFELSDSAAYFDGEDIQGEMVAMTEAERIEWEARLRRLRQDAEARDLDRRRPLDQLDTPYEDE